MSERRFVSNNPIFTYLSLGSIDKYLSKLTPFKEVAPRKTQSMHLRASERSLLEARKREKGVSRKKIFLFLVVCFALTAAAISQELPSGSIRGRFIDDTGQLLPRVSITISGPALIGKVGPGSLEACMNVFNLLGAYTLTVAKNPAGTWRPADENTTEGTSTVGSTGLRGFAGSRQFRFSLSYKF